MSELKVKTEGALPALLNLILAILAWPLITLWKGYVAVKLWTWFVTPLAPNDLPPPSIYVAVGVMFVIAAFTTRPTSRTNPSLSTNTSEAIMWPLVLLTLGAAWQWLHWGAL